MIKDYHEYYDHGKLEFRDNVLQVLMFFAHYSQVSVPTLAIIFHPICTFYGLNL